MDPVRFAEKLMEESVELHGINGFQNGRRDAFGRVHAMLVSLGYDTSGEMFVKLRYIARTCGTPINEDGEVEDVVTGTCPRCLEEYVTIYDVHAPRFQFLCGPCDNTPGAHVAAAEGS